MVKENTFHQQQFFDRFAYGYAVVDVLSFGFADRLRRQALKKIPLINGSTVIDLMCGTGNNAVHLVKDHPGKLNYVGIDFSQNMIRKAIHKFNHTGNSVQFVNANILDPLPESHKSSHLLCTYGLKCIEIKKYSTFIDTIDSLLVKEGTLSILEFQFPANRLYRELFKIYLHTFYRIGCLFFSGSGHPADALLKRIAQSMDLRLLKELFEAKGFEICIEERLSGGVVFIYGRKIGL